MMCQDINNGTRDKLGLFKDERQTQATSNIWNDASIANSKILMVILSSFFLV